MSENVQENKKSSKAIIILLIIIILLLLIGGGVAVYFLTRESDEPEKIGANGGIIQYDQAAVAFDVQDFDEMQKKADEGQMALKYVKTAYSSDGVNFTCDVGNSTANKYDMYINIYTDATFEEQILLTGLIPPGSGIKEFQSEIPLDPGIYETVMVLTQVEDDHSTFHAQLMVTFILEVEE